jgi:hypothetical protein
MLQAAANIAKMHNTALLKTELICILCFFLKFELLVTPKRVAFL